MSGHITIPAEIMRRTDLSLAARVVLGAILTCATDDGIATITQHELATACGLRREQVCRAVSEIVQNGLVSTSKGARRPTKYRVLAMMCGFRTSSGSCCADSAHHGSCCADSAHHSPVPFPVISGPVRNLSQRNLTSSSPRSEVARGSEIGPDREDSKPAATRTSRRGPLLNDRRRDVRSHPPEEIVEPGAQQAHSGEWPSAESYAAFIAGLGKHARSKTARNDQAWCQVFALRVASAFRWAEGTWLAQTVSTLAIARRLLKLPNRSEVADRIVALAADKAADPTLRNPAAAWQKAVDAILAGS